MTIDPQTFFTACGVILTLVIFASGLFQKKFTACFKKLDELQRRTELQELEIEKSKVLVNFQTSTINRIDTALEKVFDKLEEITEKLSLKQDKS